jgi:hypothetical protein
MAGWHVGDVWEPEATVTSPASSEPTTPVEPGSITFTFESPKGAKTEGTATKVSKGVWKSSQELTEPGYEKVSVTTDSPFQASQPAQIPVRATFTE